MPASVPVFELIQSLTQDEINNFFRFAKAKGDARNKKYFQLFKVLQGQDTYDESAIRDAFQGQRILNQLSVAKNYLIRLILKSLVYHARSPENEIELLLLEIKVLIRKGQWKLAERYVRKALKRAMEEERFEVAIRLLNQQKQIFILSERFEQWAGIATNIRTQRTGFRDAQFVLEQMVDLHDHYYPLLKAHFTPRGTVNMDAVHQLEAEALMQPDFPLFSTRAEYLRLNLRFWIANFQRDPAASRVRLEEMIGILESVGYLREEKFRDYLRHLYRYVVVLLQHKELAAAEKALEKLKGLKTSNFPDKAHHFYACFMGLAGLAELSGRRELIDAEMEKLNKGYAAFQDTYSQADRLAFKFLLGKNHLHQRRYKEALRCFRDIEVGSRHPVRTDVQGMARVLSLVTMYELGEFEFLRSKVRSYRGYFRDRGRFKAFEKRFLKFFSHPQIGNERFRPAEKFRVLETDLEEIFADPAEAYALNIYPVMDWVKEKVAAFTD